MAAFICPKSPWELNAAQQHLDLLAKPKSVRLPVCLSKPPKDPLDPNGTFTYIDPININQ